jgi:Fe-S-cluster containining protein
MKCKRCGECCRKGVGLTIEDMNREPRLWDIAVPIQKVTNENMKTYMIQHNMPWAIGGKTKKGDMCIFFMNDMCLIYETRPKMCRDFKCHQ